MIGDIVRVPIVGMDDVYDVFMYVAVIGGLNLVVRHDLHKVGRIVRQDLRLGRHDDPNREDDDQCVSQKEDRLLFHAARFRRSLSD
ncbi:hypothetical protein [Puniceibacterium sediminis]|uniref:hypothetical protein n=1 Tax=Puniceibacterium sediminis TaxID=1608407 RepID=UPI0011324D9C|nr:hypothetical protein [Puniceibacterium sediminis]